jgi:hypothetical protein
MKLYHGSPKKLKIIKPTQAKGLTKFENQKAIFLCKTFNHAALYAIGKTLKGRTQFAVTPSKLIIVGNQKPKSGYVYELNVGAKKGAGEQYSYEKEIRDFGMRKVLLKDYEKHITHVEDISKLKKMLK